MGEGLNAPCRNASGGDEIVSVPTTQAPGCEYTVTTAYWYDRRRHIQGVYRNCSSRLVVSYLVGSEIRCFRTYRNFVGNPKINLNTPMNTRGRIITPILQILVSSECSISRLRLGFLLKTTRPQTVPRTLPESQFKYFPTKTRVQLRKGVSHVTDKQNKKTNTEKHWHNQNIAHPPPPSAGFPNMPP